MLRRLQAAIDRLKAARRPSGDTLHAESHDAVPLDAALERIEAKLRQAVERDLRPFGAETGGLQRVPPLSPDALAAVEARLGVTLPEEYRGFVTRIGDGGAGPAYGLFPLEHAMRESNVDRVPDLLAREFPHVTAYNRDEDPAVHAFWDRVDAGEVSEEEGDSFHQSQLAGALTLCHEGCGHMHFLVVTGPARGTMWIDSSASDQGYIPLNVTFLEWYERWLDDVLAGGHGTWWFGPPVYPSGAP
jgi:hypothetical protein